MPLRKWFSLKVFVLSYSYWRSSAVENSRNSWDFYPIVWWKVVGVIVRHLGFLTLGFTSLLMSMAANYA